MKVAVKNKLRYESFVKGGACLLGVFVSAFIFFLVVFYFPYIFWKAATSDYNVSCSDGSTYYGNIYLETERNYVLDGTKYPKSSCWVITRCDDEC